MNKLVQSLCIFSLSMSVNSCTNATPPLENISQNRSIASSPSAAPLSQSPQQSPPPVSEPTLSPNQPSPTQASPPPTPTTPSNLNWSFDNENITLSWSDSNSDTTHYQLFIDGELKEANLKEKSYQLAHGLKSSEPTKKFSRQVGIKAFTPNGSSELAFIKTHLAFNSFTFCYEAEHILAKVPFESPTDTVTASCAPQKLETSDLTGMLYEDNSEPIEGAIINARSLDSSVTYKGETNSTREGTFALFDVPIGVQIELKVTKNFLSPRTRVVVLKSNPEKSPTINHFDFGNGNVYGLSVKPEIVKASPAANATEVLPDTTFTFTFSEPMNNASVENSFVIREFSEGQELNDLSGKKVHDKNDFDISWNSDDTEVSFKFKPFKQLFSSTGSVLTYQVSFSAVKNLSIQDKSGSVRKDHPFRLSDEFHKTAYIFQMKKAEAS